MTFLISNFFYYILINIDYKYVELLKNKSVNYYSIPLNKLILFYHIKKHKK